MSRNRNITQLLQTIVIVDKTDFTMPSDLRNKLFKSGIFQIKTQLLVL